MKGFGGCSIPILVFIHISKSQKHWQRLWKYKSTSPIEISIDKRLKREIEQTDVLRAISEHKNSIELCNNIQKIF